MSVIEATTNAVAELRAARAETDRLFGILHGDGIYERPIAQRHRVIFYVGHLEGFDSIQICRETLGVEPFAIELDALFQRGIDPDSSALPSDTRADWPSVEDVLDYVTRSRQHVDKHLQRAPEDVVPMALEHRLMHLETLAYMFHNFDYSKKNVALATPLESGSHSTPVNSFLEIPEGIAVLGKRSDGTFGWDNEYGEIHAAVPAFRIEKNSVSNGEYLEHVKNGAPVPHFWAERNGVFFYRGMFEEIPLPLDWPVYVTQAEAEAYARHVGKSLPTEEQFHRAAYGTPGGHQRQYPWGNGEPSPAHGNFDFRRWDPEALSMTRAGASAFGVNQLVGNGWQWTSTLFQPFAGFAPRPTYPGYSADFFDADHFVIKGGSARTAARLLRRSFRNWFRRDYPYMYATFRCVEN